MKKLKESVFAKLFLIFCVAAGLILTSLEMTEDYFAKHPSETTLGVSLFLILILIVAFLATREILSPLKELERGVTELAQGNLNVQLVVRSKDEFGRIEASFNHMTAEVRKMIRSKEQLLLDVSHEFRTPLNRINIALEVNADEKESIRQAVREMEVMIAELLETARMDDSRGAIKRSPNDLSHLLRELVSRYEESSPGVRFFSTLSSLVTEIDAPRLRVALQNLIDNAVKYSSEQDRPVEVSLDEKKGTIIISVKDFGVGISPQDQIVIFEPFYRVDQSRDRETGGYGLGLSLASKIISAHGGKLKVQSELEKGSTFTVELERLS